MLFSVVCPRYRDRGDIICFLGTNWYIPTDNVCLFIRDNERIKGASLWGDADPDQ